MNPSRDIVTCQIALLTVSTSGLGGGVVGCGRHGRPELIARGGPSTRRAGGGPSTPGTARVRVTGESRHRGYEYTTYLSLRKDLPRLAEAAEE
jgi:hypothetical protein